MLKRFLAFKPVRSALSLFESPVEARSQSSSTLTERFWELEKIRDSVIDEEKLSEKDKKILEAHRLAIEQGHFTYDDPFTGAKHYTRFRHFLFNKCCGNACRHCTFDLCNVPRSLRKGKRFNSAFWVDKDNTKFNPFNMETITKMFSKIKVAPKKLSD